MKSLFKKTKHSKTVENSTTPSLVADKPSILGPLPNFLCVGVEKAGTTSLYDLLAQHEHFGLSSNKETFFFNFHWDNGIDWYRQKFSHVPKDCRFIGEMTPSYFRKGYIANRIKETLGPDTKIIFIFRDPVKRAYSHYIHRFINKHESSKKIFRQFLQTSAYAPAAQQYINTFGRDNCLFLIFEEDLLPDHQIAIDKICDFLGAPRQTVEKVISNPSFVPRWCVSPNAQSKLIVENKHYLLDPETPVLYAGRKKHTHVLNQHSETELQALREKLERLETSISAMQAAIVHERIAIPDIRRLEQIIDRDLSCWGPSTDDLVAKIAPEPEFILVD